MKIKTYLPLLFSFGLIFCESVFHHEYSTNLILGEIPFIDKYGMSVIDIPTKEQKKFIGKSIGAKEYLQNIK